MSKVIYLFFLEAIDKLEVKAFEVEKNNYRYKTSTVKFKKKERTCVIIIVVVKNHLNFVSNTHCNHSGDIAQHTPTPPAIPESKCLQSLFKVCQKLLLL